MFCRFVKLERMIIYAVLLLWGQLLLAIDEKNPTKTTDGVIAPFPVGPKLKTCPVKHVDPELYVQDSDEENPRPFYVSKTEQLGVYTETVTEFYSSLIQTTKIINIGTTSTTTYSSTVTSTKFLTTTVLDYSVGYATTTVQLSQTVFGGTVTVTSIVETTTVSTLYITPVAATSASVITRITRTTSTVSVTATTVIKTLETTTVFSLDTISVVEVDIDFASTSVQTIFLVDPLVQTEYTTLTAYAATVTPDGFSQVVTTETNVNIIDYSRTFTLNQYISTATEGDFAKSLTITTQTFTETITTVISGIYSFTQTFFSTSLIT